MVGHIPLHFNHCIKGTKLIHGEVNCTLDIIFNRNVTYTKGNTNATIEAFTEALTQIFLNISYTNFGTALVKESHDVLANATSTSRGQSNSSK